MTIPLAEILLRLLVTAVLGAIIGYEREHREKPAGMRTNVLVALGTTVATIASVEVAGLNDNSTTDIARLAASILPAIGFIGAGTIIQAAGSVKGLTTAASIWVVACLGIAVGLGLYALAIFATIIALLTLLMLPRLNGEEKK